MSTPYNFTGLESDMKYNHYNNVNTTHPLINNSNEYIYYKKYISIHSEDRDLLKFPNSSEFEIELPEDLLNISSIKLADWSFPSNYDVFSSTNTNLILLFKITDPYNPAEYGVSDEYSYRIYEALFSYRTDYYLLTIEAGFYNPDQITTELTNKMNFVVSEIIGKYFIDKGWLDTYKEFIDKKGYQRFNIVYNSVTSRIWFGNTADSFTLLNKDIAEKSFLENKIICDPLKKSLPDISNWGLPNNLGFTRCNVSSIDTVPITPISQSFGIYNGKVVPRFYYNNFYPGIDGYWLLPEQDLSGSSVHWIEAPFKINLMGQAYMYMEIEGQNCIDETQPFNVSTFTLTTNQTNGVVNSSFAKLKIPTTPMSQWFDFNSPPQKIYYPPAERIRRLKFRIRYHDGSLVDFGLFNYSFMLQFTLMVPQILRKSNTSNYPGAGISAR